MEASCNYPEAYLGGEVLFENNYFYMNTSGPMVDSTTNFINFHGPANLTFWGNYMWIFHDSSVRRRIILSLPSIPFCHPVGGYFALTFENNDCSIPIELTNKFAHYVLINAGFNTQRKE